MTVYFNCTPHDIVLCDEKGAKLRTFERSNHQLRLTTMPQMPIEFDDIDVPVVTRQIFDDVKFVDHRLQPPPVGSVLLVSLPVGEFFASHPEICTHWVLGPDSGPDSAVRDEKGQIIGTKRFIYYAQPHD